jgi:predicted MPP superfamily phosphohydrolase
MPRRPFALLFAVSLFVAMVASAHGYLVQRLVRDTGLPAPWDTLGSSAIILGGVLLFAYPTSDRIFGPRVGRVFAWPTMLWLGTLFYVLIGLWASDIVLVIAGLHGPEVARMRALWLCALSAAVVVFGVSAASRLAPVKRVEIRLDGWPAALDGYRILQISDIHIGPTLRRAFAQRLVARCNALSADLIAITGDLVDGSVAFLNDEVAPFAELRARDGVYFVTGNHDYYSGGERWARKVSELGIDVLRNRRVAIERDGARFELAGVDDLSSSRVDGRPGHDLNAALDGWSTENPVVLLAHDPRTFDQARRRGVHLQLSGHTHGGQLWPFAWLVRLQTRYVAGLYQRDRSLLYVSRGTGYWGPPMRVFAPAEITDIRLGASNT